jgi:hypothetical protein
LSRQQARVEVVDVKGEHLTVVRPLPHFNVRKTAASLTVTDGDTVVLSGFGTLEEPAHRKPENGKTLPATPAETKELLVFVTPMLVDPAGNRLHPNRPGYCSSMVVS